MEEKQKPTVSIDVEIPEGVSHEQFAEQVAASLKNLNVRSVARENAKISISAGYDSRLWEKATC